MITRIKRMRVLGKDLSVYTVQELGNDGVFRTIEGGYAKDREGAEKIRKAYKLTAKRVEQFNAKFQHQVLKFPVDYEKSRDK